MRLDDGLRVTPSSALMGDLKALLGPSCLVVANGVAYGHGASTGAGVAASGTVNSAGAARGTVNSPG
jgi:hypothetical protein